MGNVEIVHEEFSLLRGGLFAAGELQSVRVSAQTF